MHTYVYIIITILLLTACSPNKPTIDRTKSTTISIEQQKRDALATLEIENALLESANTERSLTESSLFNTLEPESQDKELVLLELAKSQKIKAEQDLTDSAKLKSEKMQALLDQEQNADKIIQPPDGN